MNTVNLTGQRFGRLLVVDEAEPQVYHTPKRKVVKRRWRCLCDCGQQCVVSMSNLRSGHTKSCGCLQDECRQAHIKKMTIHNEWKTRLFGIWTGIKNRTSNPNVESFGRYGGRGIAICDEWKESYDAFRRWAISHGYQDNLSIDRINPDGDYTPDNCRWVTVKEQANNRRSNRYITYNNPTLTLMQWSEVTGLHWSTIRGRLNRGWSVEDALTISAGGRRNG